MIAFCAMALAFWVISLRSDCPRPTGLLEDPEVMILPSGLGIPWRYGACEMFVICCLVLSHILFYVCFNLFLMLFICLENLYDLNLNFLLALVRVIYYMCFDFCYFNSGLPESHMWDRQLKNWMNKIKFIWQSCYICFDHQCSCSVLSQTLTWPPLLLLPHVLFFLHSLAYCKEKINSFHLSILFLATVNCFSWIWYYNILYFKVIYSPLSPPFCHLPRECCWNSARNSTNMIVWVCGFCRGKGSKNIQNRCVNIWA